MPRRRVSKPHLNRSCADLLAGSVSDAAFDGLLPAVARVKSKQYWSPISVARRAATRFARHGCRRVLDVGCGPGKFCIAGAIERPDVHFFGVEQRTGLAETAMEPSASPAPTKCGVQNRRRAARSMG